MTTSKKPASSEIICAVCDKEIRGLSEMATLKGVILCTDCHDRAKEPEPAADTAFDLSRLTKGSEIAAGDYQISFVVDRLVPENAVILFYAKGGSGKSTLATQIGAAVESGEPFMGLPTSKRPVVVLDHENPKAVLKKRIDAIPGAGGIYFWTADSNPPQLDKRGWIELKQLVQTLVNPLVIIDTLSSACSSLDISSNKDYAQVMSRIVEIRDAGATVILLHHTPKGDETKYIGASCIYNQVDHVLAMYPVRQAGTDQEAVDDDEVKIYRLGTREKTRFEHYHLYVEFDDCSGVFAQAPDPDTHLLEQLLGIITRQPGINQTVILNQIGPVGKIKKLLHNHTGHYWTITRGERNAKHYYPNSVCQSDAPLRPVKLSDWNKPDKTACQTAKKNNHQTIEDAEFVSLTGGICQTGKQEDDSIIDALYGDGVPL